MSRTIALSKAARVAISRGSSRGRAKPGEVAGHRDDPACGALVERLAVGRGGQDRPVAGQAMPSASARQFMLLAVNIPEQLPQVGQAAFSIASSCSALIWPLWRFAPAMKASIRSTVLPASVLPPPSARPRRRSSGS
jgi:hypothetical protein